MADPVGVGAPEGLSVEVEGRKVYLSTSTGLPIAEMTSGECLMLARILFEAFATTAVDGNPTHLHHARMAMVELAKGEV